jgi:hypothetical protein
MTTFVARKFPVEMIVYGHRLTVPVTRQMYELCNTKTLLSCAGLAHKLDINCPDLNISSVLTEYCKLF